MPSASCSIEERRVICKMKQLIVMIATILLGIAIAVVVLGFSGTAESLSSGVTSKITSTFGGYYRPGK